jgi:hypothetical protein
VEDREKLNPAEADEVEGHGFNPDKVEPMAHDDDDDVEGHAFKTDKVEPL